MARIEYTNLWTRDGLTFVRENQNVLTHDGSIHSAHIEWLVANGYYQKIIVWYKHDTPEENGWREINGTRYWARALEDTNEI